MSSLSARIEGSNRVTLREGLVSKGLVVNAGDVPESVGDPARVMYPGSESDPSGVMCVCSSGMLKRVSPVGSKRCGVISGVAEAVSRGEVSVEEAEGSDKTWIISKRRSSGWESAERRGGVVQTDLKPPHGGLQNDSK